MSLNYKHLLIFVFIIFTSSVWAMPTDSLRLEKRKGQQFIIHRVEPQETLFSISRRYNVTLDEIEKYNPEVKEGLKMFAELKIPYGDRKGRQSRKEEKTPDTPRAQESDYHIINAGETLFAISRKYGISVDAIKEINGLSSNEISVGDTLRLKHAPVVEISPAPNQKNTPTTHEKFHVVVPSETLFAISRKYGITVDSLRAYNQLSSNSIGVGDTLWLSTNRAEAPPVNQPTSKPKDQQTSKPTNRPSDQATKIDSSLYHFVKPSETLFSISKQYELDLDTLVKWNELDSYNLSIGQRLVIAKGGQATKTSAPPIVKIEPPKKKQLDTLYVETDNSPIRTKSNLNAEGRMEILQEGFAMEIEDTDHTSKYLALHRDAPPGTLMKVVNQMNGKTVDVRVVGNLPESGLNKNVMLRISHAAFVGLGALDFKIPVQASYVEK